jgi:glycosyltransferase involved in cell wall biosynthesis
MRVLLYSKYFMPIPGGVQSIVLELALGLAAWSSLNPGEVPINVTVVTPTIETTPEDDALPFPLVRRPGFLGLIRLLRDADVVHLAGPAMVPLALSLILRKTLIVEHHGFQVSCPTGLLFYEPEQVPCPGYFMARQYRKCMKCQKGSDGIIKSAAKVVITKIRRSLSNRAFINIMPTDWLGTILKLKRMQTIHHGVSDGGQNTSGAPSSPVVFAYHGRLVSTKGVRVLIEAAQKLSELGRKFHLKIIGDGDEFTTLQRLGANLGSKIEFLGHVPNEKLDDALEDVGTIVMPSLGGEVFGLVAAENMLRRKLLIVSDLGPLQEVVGDTGLNFHTGDSDDLAECMQKVLDKPLLPASLGAAAQARVKRLFDRESMIQKHILVYREAISLERTRS